MGLWSTIGKFFGSPGGAQVTDLAGNLIGAGLQTRAANRAADQEDRYLQRAMDYQEEQDRLARDMYLEERGRGWAREDARDARLQPYQAQGTRGLNTLASLLLDPNAKLARAQPFPSVQRRTLKDLL